MAPFETFLKGSAAHKNPPISSFLASVVSRACRTPSAVVAPKDAAVHKRFGAKPRRDAVVHTAGSGQAAHCRTSACCRTSARCRTSATSIKPRKWVARLRLGTCQQSPAPGCPRGKRHSCWSQPDRHIWGYVVVSRLGHGAFSSQQCFPCRRVYARGCYFLGKVLTAATEGLRCSRSILPAAINFFASAARLNRI